MVLVFDSRNKKFVISLGADLQQSKLNKNYIEIIKPYKSNYILPVNEEIQVGEFSVSSDILIYETCQLTYDIKVFYCDKELQHVSYATKSNSINIRIPYYKDVSLYKGLSGSVYVFCEKYNVLKSNYSELKMFDNSIINIF